MVKSKTESPTRLKTLLLKLSEYTKELKYQKGSEMHTMEREKSDRLTVAKLNAVKQYNKQDHKSKLMTEKYSLLPLNPQQLTPVQTAIQRMSEKYLDFKIETVNTIQPPEIEYTMLQAFGGYHLLLVITCDQTNFTIAVPLRDRTAQTVAEALIYRVIYLFGPPRQILCDEAISISISVCTYLICTYLQC